MNSGNLWYYGLSKNTYPDMIKLMLHLAKDECLCDAFSTHSCMDNKYEELGPLGFLRGDGVLHYYLVNWSIGDEIIAEKDLGCIMI